MGNFKVGSIYTNGKRTREITKIDGSEIYYKTESGKEKQCWITTFQDWVKKGEKIKKSSCDSVGLLKEIIRLAEKDIAIDYTIIDQKLNGTYSDDEPLKTYTVNIFDKWSFGNPIDNQNFNDLEQGLMWAINRGKELLEVR